MDELRNHIASIKIPSAFSGRLLDGFRADTITTNNVPSMMINAVERHSLDMTSIRKELIDSSFTKLQTYVDECDCLAFKGSIKQATILNTANQL